MLMTPLSALNSAELRGLGLYGRSDAVSAYRKILRAEARAIRDREEENAELARVVGYLLLELYARRHILSDRPFEKIIQEVTSPSQSGENVEYDESVVFEIGR